MKDVRRLYVNTMEREALGFLDLATLAVFPDVYLAGKRTSTRVRLPRSMETWCFLSKDR